MISNICRKCVQVLCVCLPLIVGVVAPVIDNIHSPPAVMGSAVQASPPEIRDIWAPHGEEGDRGTNQPAIHPVAGTVEGTRITAYSGLSREILSAQVRTAG